MTPQEFDAGWALLLAQPFAHLYQRDAAAEAVQRRLYFEELKWSDGTAWIRIAKDFACGSKWPSLDEIRPSLRSAQPRPRQIESNRPFKQPEVIGKLFDHMRTNGTGFDAALRNVLPDWVKDHPGDEFASEMLVRMRSAQAGIQEDSMSGHAK